VENVSALLFNGIDRVCGDLATIGYDAEWEVISACMFGAPHSRERLFVIAYPYEVGWDDKRKYFNGRHELPPRCDAWKASPSQSGWKFVQRWIIQAMETGLGFIAPRERSGMADGIPSQLDRIGALGNAVVPQIAEWIGRMILESEQS
jgi:DNA (cytosine-5)-methyltransferase 1